MGFSVDKSATNDDICLFISLFPQRHWYPRSGEKTDFDVIGQKSLINFKKSDLNYIFLPTDDNK
jgi:hypothetical protein